MKNCIIHIIIKDSKVAIGSDKEVSADELITSFIALMQTLKHKYNLKDQDFIEAIKENQALKTDGKEVS